MYNLVANVNDAIKIAPLFPPPPPLPSFLSQIVSNVSPRISPTLPPSLPPPPSPLPPSSTSCLSLIVDIRPCARHSVETSNEPFTLTRVSGREQWKRKLADGSKCELREHENASVLWIGQTHLFIFPHPAKASSTRASVHLGKFALTGLICLCGREKM